MSTGFTPMDIAYAQYSLLLDSIQLLAGGVQKLLDSQPEFVDICLEIEYSIAEPLEALKSTSRPRLLTEGQLADVDALLGIIVQVRDANDPSLQSRGAIGMRSEWSDIRMAAGRLLDKHDWRSTMSRDVVEALLAAGGWPE